MNNKLADFPLERAGLGDAPDETVIVAWPGWNLTVGDVKKARGDVFNESECRAKCDICHDGNGMEWSCARKCALKSKL